MINYLAPDFSAPPGRCAGDRSGRVFRYERGVTPAESIDVSIVTPYYNTEDFFVETFESIRAQSLQNWEWVIVDDGSSDAESVARLNEIAARDDRIRTIRQDNAGPAAARNASFRHTRGRYVCLLDSDDLLEPTYLEKCVWFLDSNPEFAFCNSYSVVFGDQNYLWTTGFERGKAHVKANSGPPISVVRRAAFLACGGFDESIRMGHEDWDFWLAMAKTGHWGYTIPEFLQWYRKRSGGRFEQIMRTGSVNDEFEASMRAKYDGLESSFPEPSRRHQAPYEDVEMRWDVHNDLARNPMGRRIMFLVPWMVAGGADRVNLDLIDGLHAKGHDVTICATLPADHRWEYEFSRFSSDIFVLPNILHATDYPRFLAYLIQSRGIDTVLITGSTLGYKLLPLLRSVAPDVAFIDMCHVEEPHWINGGHPRFGVAYQEMLDLNIATTQNLADWMCRKGADSSRISVMYTGVRAAKNVDEDHRELRAELCIPQNLPIIVFAGRICEQKRPAMLARILKELHDRGIPFRALIIGDGELRSGFEALLQEYKLTEVVQMLGSVAHQRWLRVLAASDILLMPSQYEGISIALLEAMASGVVPVVAKVGGQDEIVGPGAGVLVPHGDSELDVYVDSLQRLLMDREALRAMSLECVLVAQTKLSWQGMIDKFIDIVNRAHDLRVNHPRVVIPAEFSRELAVQALECKRLEDAVHWLWNAKPHGASVSFAPTAETQAVARLAIALSQTWVGRKLINNRWIQAIGRYALQRFGRSGFA